LMKCEVYGSSSETADRRLMRSWLSYKPPVPRWGNLVNNKLYKKISK
jgi:hypothetical protein